MLTAHASPVRPDALWSSWPTDAAVVLALIGFAVAYGLGARAGRGRAVLAPIVRRRTRSGVAAVVVLVVALVSPLDAAADATFAAHMAQHLLLSAVAAPLLALAAPAPTIRRALPHRWRPRADALARTVAGPQWWRSGVSLVGATAAATGTLTVWHVPVLYDLALRSAAVHALEHATILGTAAVFWSTVVRAARRSQILLGVGALGVACAHGAALGALLALAPRAWYDHDTTGWGIDPLADQQVAGALMWIPASTVYLAAAGLLLHRALRPPPDRRTHREPASATKAP